jgi:1-acyl-sn-glycerol-3-phosphate acyltransferase
MGVPAPELLRLLSPLERAALRLGDLFARRLRLLPLLSSLLFMGPLILLLVARRLHVLGAEGLRELPRDASVVLVANHRSYFDFFVVVPIVRARALRGFRFYFPVRSEFFYDHPIGLLVNLVVAAMSMFPPIFRRGAKRRLNRWGLDRAVALLARPRTGLGLHPEGTRGRGSDPFDLLPARPGVGRVVLEAARAHVVPVFILGLGNSIVAELSRSLSPRRHPLLVAFGREVDLGDLRAGERTPSAEREAAERCRAAILRLAEEVRPRAASLTGGAPAPEDP